MHSFTISNFLHNDYLVAQRVEFSEAFIEQQSTSTWGPSAFPKLQFIQKKKISQVSGLPRLCATQELPQFPGGVDLDVGYLEHSNQGVKDLAKALPSNLIMKLKLYVLALPLLG